MAVVCPFSALRYDVTRVPDLAAVLAPPYDVINADEQAALYARDPHNVIRLEYGQQTSTDSATDNRYTRAQAALSTWRAEGTLVQERQPAFYPQQSRFTWDGQHYTRTGFFAAVELHPFDAGVVLPHEWTLKGPKVDRLQLMQSCLTSFSPVLGLYDGADGEIPALLQDATTTPPLGRAQGYGFDETLWCETAAARCARLTAALAQQQILIADGHHRYETLLALRDEFRQTYPSAPPTAAFNYAFMLLLDIRDPGLLVLPTHRLLMLTPAMRAAFCRLAGQHFRLEALPTLTAADIRSHLAAHTDGHAFIWYADGHYTLLTSPKTQREGLPVLDVVALQERLIAPLLALDPAGEASVERNVRYTAYAHEAVARVDAGEAAGAIFLNATPLDEVFTLAKHGVRLPQKSTYFYPKAPTGLVMYDLNPAVARG